MTFPIILIENFRICRNISSSFGSFPGVAEWVTGRWRLTSAWVLPVA
jgi:hypothetical protein